MSESPLLIGADDVVLSKEELVQFDNVQSCFTLNKAFRLKYSIGSFVHASPHDWIGLFPAPCQTVLDPVLFQKAAPKPKHRNKKHLSKRTVLFSVSNLRESVICVSQPYQFVYVTASDDVIGVSRPFVFQPDSEKSPNSPSAMGATNGTAAKSDDDSPLNTLNTDFSIINTPSKGLPQSECPVLVSSSICNSEEEWESIHSIEPPNDGNVLSDVSSEIEILSTSPSKERDLTSPFEMEEADDALPDDAQLQNEQTLIADGSRVLNNLKTVQDLTAFTLETAQVPVAISGIDKDQTATAKPTGDDCSDPKSGQAAACSAVSYQSKSEDVTPTVNMHEFCNKINPDAKVGDRKIKKEKMKKKKKQWEKKLLFNTDESFEQAGIHSVSVLQSLQAPPVVNAKVEVEKKNVLVEEICELHEMKNEKTKHLHCKKTKIEGESCIQEKMVGNPCHNVEKKNEKNNCKAEETKSEEEDRKISVKESGKKTGKNEETKGVNSGKRKSKNRDNLRTLEVTKEKEDKSPAANRKSPTVVIMTDKDSVSSPPAGLQHSLNENPQIPSAKPLSPSPFDDKRNGKQMKESEDERLRVEADWYDSKTSKKGQKRKKRKIRSVEDDIESSFECTKTDINGNIYEGNNQFAALQQADQDSGNQTQTSDDSQTVSEMTSHIIAPKTQEAMNEDKEIDNIRQKYISKASALVENKLKKPVKGKKAKKTLEDNSQTNSNRENNNDEVSTLKREDAESVSHLLEISQIKLIGKKVDDIKASFQGGTAGKCPLKASGQQKSLSSMLKDLDPFAPSVKGSRPHVPGYLLDVMDALPVAKEFDGKNLKDWPKALLPKRLNEVKKQLKLQEMQECDSSSPDAPSASNNAKQENIKKRGTKPCLNGSYASIVKNESYASIVIASGCKDQTAGKTSSDSDKKDGITSHKGEANKVVGKDGVLTDENGNIHLLDSSDNMSKLCDDVALDMQITVLRNVDQKHRNRFKRRQVRRLRQGKVEMRILKAKRLRKQLNLARRNKETDNANGTATPSEIEVANIKGCDSQNTTGLLTNGNVEKSIDEIMKLASRKENDTVLALTWPYPAFLKVASKSKHLSVAPLAPLGFDKMSRQAEDPHLRIHLPVHPHPVRHRGGNKIKSVEECDVKRLVMGGNEEDRGVTSSACSELINMALTSSLEANQRLRREAGVLTRKLAEVEKKLSLANAECREHKKTKRRDNQDKDKTAKAKRQSSSTMAQMQIDKLTSKLKASDREVSSLENQVNALKEQLKKAASQPRMDDVTVQVEVSQTESEPKVTRDCAVTYIDIETIEEVLEPAKKKRKLEPDTKITTEWQVQSELKTSHDATPSSDIPLKKSLETFSLPMPHPPHNIFADFQGQSGSQNIVDESQPTTSCFTAHSMSSPPPTTATAITAEDTIPEMTTSRESVCATTNLSLSPLVSPEGLDLGRQSLDDRHHPLRWVEAPTFHSRSSRSQSLGRYPPPHHNPRSSPSLSYMNGGPDTSNCLTSNHKAPLAPDASSYFQPSIPPRNTTYRHTVPPMASWNTSWGAGHGHGFGGTTPYPTMYGTTDATTASTTETSGFVPCPATSLNRRKSPIRIKPFLRQQQQQSYVQMPRQERRAKSMAVNHGCPFNLLGQHWTTPRMMSVNQNRYSSQDLGGNAIHYAPGGSTSQQQMPRPEYFHRRAWPAWKSGVALNHGKAYQTQASSPSAAFRNGHFFCPTTMYSRDSEVLNPAPQAVTSINASTTHQRNSLQSTGNTSSSYASAATIPQLEDGGYRPAFHHQPRAATRYPHVGHPYTKPFMKLPDAGHRDRMYNQIAGEKDLVDCAFLAQSTGADTNAHFAREAYHQMPHQTTDNVFQWDMSASSCEMQAPGLNARLNADPCFQNNYGQTFHHHQDPYVANTFSLNHSNNNGNHVTSRGDN